MKSKMQPENLELARRIRAAGILIDVREDNICAPPIPRQGVFIYQTGGVPESSAFDWFGGTGFIVSLKITVNQPAFAISAIELEVPWGDWVRLLQDPQRVDCDSRAYQFGGWPCLEFDREDVLNHHADVRRLIRCGSSIEGLLLGTGSRSIPDEFQHGASIPAIVTIYDQYMNKYRSSVSLWADRSEKLRRAAHPKPKRKRLFECPDSNSWHGSRELHEAEQKK